MYVGPWWLTKRAELFILCISAGESIQNTGILFPVDESFEVCYMCFTKCYTTKLWSLSGKIKTTGNINFNIYRKSSISARLIPKLVTCCAPARSCTRTWPWSLSRHTVNFSDARHTLSFQHLHADPHCGLAASSRAASVCSMFWSIGTGVGWGGVGLEPQLEVGQSF